MSNKLQSRIILIAVRIVKQIKASLYVNHMYIIFKKIDVMLVIISMIVKNSCYYELLMLYHAFKVIRPQRSAYKTALIIAY